MVGRLILFVVMAVAGTGSVHAQRISTAKELNARPQEFEGKKVQVFVGEVDFPPMTINKENKFQDFEVSTREDGYGKVRTEYGGKIAVRVPEEQVEDFSRLHGVRIPHSGAVQREKIVGIFRACKTKAGGYIDLTDGSAQDIDPKTVR